MCVCGGGVVVFWVFFFLSLGTEEEREVRKKERDDVKICQGKIN